MVRGVFVMVIAVPAIAPGVAFAQADASQVVATAPAGPAAPLQQRPDGQVASVSDAAAADSVRDDGPVRDNRVHGEVSVGVGTNGYRQIGGVITAPIGDVGQATIAVDSEQYRYHRR